MKYQIAGRPETWTLFETGIDYLTLESGGIRVTVPAAWCAEIEGWRKAKFPDDWLKECRVRDSDRDEWTVVGTLVGYHPNGDLPWITPRARWRYCEVRD